VTVDRCEYEEAVLRAVQSGQLTRDLQAHLDGCEACQEARLVTIFFDTLPETQLTNLPLPSPESIWWRGQIAQKRELAERSVAAISIVQKIAGLLIVGLLGVLTILWAPQLLDGLSRVAYLSAATVLFLAGSALVLYAWATERI
jgi:hypothetical protein